MLFQGIILFGTYLLYLLLKSSPVFSTKLKPFAEKSIFFEFTAKTPHLFGRPPRRCHVHKVFLNFTVSTKSFAKRTKNIQFVSTTIYQQNANQKMKWKINNYFCIYGKCESNKKRKIKCSQKGIQ